jgi:hypothetical protein
LSLSLYTALSRDLLSTMAGDVRPPVLILKLGSSSIVDDQTGFLALSRLALLVECICALKRGGARVILVTSGAVGVGMRRLGMATRPKDMVQKQVPFPRAAPPGVCAAVASVWRAG